MTASLVDTITGWALGSSLTLTRLGPWRQFINAAQAPARAQEAALHRILRANENTDFGHAHGFADIKNPDDYRRAVPVQTFDSLQPYAAAQNTEGTHALTSATPVFYQRTSGTLGTPKDVPMTQAGIEMTRRHQRIAAYAQHSGAGLFKGRIVGVGGPAIEGYTAGGAPFGSATGLIYENQPAFVRAKFVLPPAVFAIADYDARYYAIAALSIAEPNVTGLAAANPSTLVKLLEVINANAESLLRNITEGKLSPHDGVAAARPASPRRARELGAALERTGRLTYADLWPGLAGVVTWMGGSCAVPLSALRPQLPDTTKIIEAGYVSSEFRGTINVDVGRNLCLPTLLDHYFEFVQRDARDRGEDRFLSLDQLEVGESYYPIVTTADGLYRYDINDIVSVTGKVGATPTLAFVQKGKGVTNITGEKITEAQIIAAVQQLAGNHAAKTSFFVVLADEAHAEYVLYLELAEGPLPSFTTIADAFDTSLRALNGEYDGKRASGRLQPARAIFLRPGSGDAYRRQCVANGQREAQFKVRHLQYADEVSFPFRSHAVEEARP